MREPTLHNQETHIQWIERYRTLCGGNWLRLAGDAEIRQNLCAHLFGAAEFDALFALVAESDAWAKARYQHEGDYAGYLSDLLFAWRWAESEGGWSVVRQWRCLLIQSAVLGLTHPARQDTDRALAWFLKSARRPLPVEACSDALALAAGIRNEALKANLLGNFTVDLPDPFQRIAFAHLQGIGDVRLQGRSLLMRLRELPPDLRDQAIQLVWDSLPAEDDQGAAYTLSYLALVLNNGLESRALEAAQGIQSNEARADALADMAAAWSGEWRERAMRAALEALRTIQEDECKVVTLARFLESWRRPVPADLLEVFYRQTTEGYWRRAALVIILPYLEVDRVIPLVSELLQSASIHTMAGPMASQLLAFLDYPIGELRSQVIEMAWSAASTIAGGEKRLWFFRRLIPKLTLTHESEMRRRAIGEARGAIAAIGDLRLRAIKLADLALDAGELQTALFGEALSTAASIPDNVNRAHAFAYIAPELPVEMRMVALRNCLAAARATVNTWVQAITLERIAEKLTPELAPEALAIAETIQNPTHKAHALIYLAARFPMEFGSQIQTIARQMRDDRALAHLLVSLAANAPDESKPALLREALRAAVLVPLGERPEPARSTLFHWILTAWRKVSYAGISRDDFAQLLHALGREPLGDLLDTMWDYVYGLLSDHMDGLNATAATFKSLRDVLTWWPQPEPKSEEEAIGSDATPTSDGLPF